MRHSEGNWAGGVLVTQHRRTVFLAGVSLLLVLSGCREIPTSVKVRSGPSFALRGSGQLAIFTVYAPQSGQRIAFPHPALASAVWQIRASEGYFKGTHVDGLQLTYGKVPSGYQQLVPVQSQVAPQLSPEQFIRFLQKRPMLRSQVVISTWTSQARSRRRFLIFVRCWSRDAR